MSIRDAWQAVRAADTLAFEARTGGLLTSEALEAERDAERARMALADALRQEAS